MDKLQNIKLFLVIGTQVINTNLNNKIIKKPF